MSLTKEELEFVEKTLIDRCEELFAMGRAGRENYKRILCRLKECEK